MSAGQDKTFRVEGWNIGGSADTWDISTLETGDAATTANFNIVAGSSSLALPSSGRGSFTVTVEATQTAVPGSYEGSVVLVSRATGMRLHIPVWLRVLPPVDRDVLLIDDDGSPGGGRADYRSTYTSLLDSLGLTYDVYAFAGPFPTVENLHRYRSIVVFTGDHASFATSGFTVANHDALAEYLDSGGRLWAVGQNWALTADSGTFHSRLDRGRITSGYLGLAFESNSVYGTNPAPQPTANGLGPFAAMTLSLNQSSIDVLADPGHRHVRVAAHDDAVLPPDRRDGAGGQRDLVRPVVGAEPRGGAAGVPVPRPLDGLRPRGLVGGPTRTQLGDRVMDWLLDKVTVDLESSTAEPGKRTTLTADAASSVGSSIVRYRWDFGDGTPYVTTDGPSVHHKYQHRGPTTSGSRRPTASATAPSDTRWCRSSRRTSSSEEQEGAPSAPPLLLGGESRLGSMRPCRCALRDGRDG